MPALLNFHGTNPVWAMGSFSQINTDEKTWVSASPYLHAFDGLDAVHHQMEEKALTKAMNEIGYRSLKTDEYPLPNGKKLVMLDFER